MYLRNVPPEQEWQSLLTTILVPHLWMVAPLQFQAVHFRGLTMFSRLRRKPCSRRVVRTRQVWEAEVREGLRGCGVRAPLDLHRATAVAITLPP